VPPAHAPQDRAGDGISADVHIGMARKFRTRRADQKVHGRGEPTETWAAGMKHFLVWEQQGGRFFSFHGIGTVVRSNT